MPHRVALRARDLHKPASHHPPGTAAVSSLPKLYSTTVVALDGEKGGMKKGKEEKAEAERLRGIGEGANQRGLHWKREGRARRKKI